MADDKPISTMSGVKTMKHVTATGKVLTQMEFAKLSKAAKKGARGRKGIPLSPAVKMKMAKTRKADAKKGINRKGVKLSVIAMKRGSAIKSGVKPISTMSCKKRRK